MKQVFCVFNVLNQKVLFVDAFDEKSDADFMCDSMNNFSYDFPCRFIVRCLDSTEYDEIITFLDGHRYKDISSVYDPFITRIFVRA